MVLYYTDAPVDYDYPYTTEIESCVGMTNCGFSKPVRLVNLDEDRKDFQIGRYQSGLYFVCDQKTWAAEKRDMILRDPLELAKVVVAYAEAPEIAVWPKLLDMLELAKTLIKGARN
jgi:hypothetical protein